MKNFKIPGKCEYNQISIEFFFVEKIANIIFFIDRIEFDYRENYFELFEFSYDLQTVWSSLWALCQ